MIDLCEQVPAYLQALAPYQPGKPISELQRELGLTSVIKLASNENPLGPSPLALQAITEALPGLALYPDGGGHDLKQALGAHFQVVSQQIVLGNGSNDVLELVARAFLGPGTSAVYAQHAFAVYPLVTQAVGAQGIEVPAKEFGHDLDAMIAALRPDTRVLFLANPNNPTGTFISGARLHAALQRIPSRILVVLDEAYTEYLQPQQRYSSFGWLPAHSNLLISRTFSKAYGLAGLRVGFGVAHPDVIQMLERVRQPFNVNALALTAAQAALQDHAFLERSCALNQAGLTQLEEGFKRLSLSYIPSVGNFLSVRVGNASGVYQQLLAQGVIVRPVAAYQMPEYLRVSVGTEQENLRFLQALDRALHSAR